MWTRGAWGLPLHVTKSWASDLSSSHGHSLLCKPTFPSSQPWCLLLRGQRSQPSPPSALALSLFLFLLGLMADTRWSLQEADSEMRSKREDVYGGRLLRLMPVEGRGRSRS